MVCFVRTSYKGDGSYKGLGLNVIGVDASEQFFKDLEGVTDPEQKRKIIGRDFVEVFNAEAKKITDAKWLAQGTIYQTVLRVLASRVWLSRVIIM